MYCAMLCATVPWARSCMYAPSGVTRRSKSVIEDQGPGVPEKDLRSSRAFSTVWMQHVTVRKAGRGWGLRSRARAIVLHHGTIEARNLSATGLARAHRSAGAGVKKKKAALAGGFQRRSKTTGGDHRRLKGGEETSSRSADAGQIVTFLSVTVGAAQS